MSKAKDIVDDALATAMHAMRTTVATTLGSAPGSLAFARDMWSFSVISKVIMKGKSDIAMR
eukprot:scaffold34249_cov24-Cyclotella_meneghiniana.AAC.1